MSDTEFDVVIAAYLIPDLAQQDFDALVKLVKGKQLTVEGVALVTNDAGGNVTIQETGDHLGRKGMEIGGGVGLVVDRSYASKAPFTFTGTVKKVVFDVAPHPDGKDELALHEHAQQAHAARGINA